MTEAEPQTRTTSRRKRWAFRLAAVLLGLTPFLLFELLCIGFDWGRAYRDVDPFVGFSTIHPLFVPDESNERMVIAPSRLKFFAAESFPAQKPPNTFRIFCLGGSTVQGRPYSTPTAFTTWLRLNLTAPDPTVNWEVVNCGGISYASYRLVPILEECLTYQPDLIVICTGHNEFLEDRSYAHIKHTPALLKYPLQALSRLRSFRLLRETFNAGASADDGDTAKPQLKSEADALLDYRNGIEAYHRDDDRTEGIVAHYAHNLRRMLALAKEAQVPVVLIAPPSNLADCPPFKSQHRDDLTDDELAQWNELMERARAAYRTDLDGAIALLKQAIALDDRYAAAHYELGKCFAARALHAEARAAFVRARDEDICPLRMISALERELADIAAETGTPLINVHWMLEGQTSTGILGGAQLVDHIHPNFNGHQQIANAIADYLLESGQLTWPVGWRQKRDEAYDKHLNSLDDLYHLRGQRTLENLRAWSAGRADGPMLKAKDGD